MRLGQHVTPKDRRFLARFEEIVSEHYSLPTFTVGQMALCFGVSERQLQRRLQAAGARPPSQYLRNFRLAKSLEVLRLGYSIHDVAKAVGFTSQSYFTTCFKVRFGATPTEYQHERL